MTQRSVAPAVPVTPSLLETPASTPLAPSALPLASPAPAAPPSTVLVFPAAHAPGAAPPPPPRLGSSSPEALVPDTPYSLLDDLRQASQQHAGTPKEKVSLYQFPSYLATNLRRVLARNRNHRADWAVALSCLVWQGLARYSALPAAQSLSAGLLALDTDDDLATVAAEQVETWRRGFRFSISDPSHTLGLERCRSFRAPEHIQAELHDLAGRLGLSGSTLGVVAVMAALHDQDGVLTDHARHMRDTVLELDALLAERARRLESLVRAIDAGVWR
jgi:hypothetical protein